MNPNQKLSDTVLLLEHMAACVRQQAPMQALVSRLSEVAADKAAQARLTNLAEALSRGVSLGDALLAWPGLGRATLSAWLRTEEEHGQLQQALTVLSEDLQLQDRRRQQNRLALGWPAAMLATAVVASTVVSVFVLPSFRTAFESMGLTMPGPTLAYFSFLPFADDIFSMGFVVSLLALVLVVWLMFGRPSSVDRFFHVVGLDRGRWALETQLRLLPVLGHAQTSAGLPLYLRYLADTTPIPSIRQRLERAVRSVDAGETLSSAVAQERLVPATVQAHIDVAQRTDNLPAIARLLGQQLNDLWTLASVRFEQRLTWIIYLVAAFLAFGLLVAVYLPIFELGQSV